MTLVIKAITPKKFKDKVFKSEFRAGMREVAKDMEKEFKKTVKGWEGDKPGFKSILSIEPTELAVFTGPTGEGKGAQKWMWLNEGTRPHIITAKSGGRLAFMTAGFQSKTLPGTLATRGGRRAGPPMTRPQSVNHPGTAPRGWDEMVGKIYLPRFKRRMEKAMRTAAQKSGHGV